MTITWQAVILFLALVCFVLAAFNVAVGKIQVIALGLALWVLVIMLSAAGVN